MSSNQNLDSQFVNRVKKQLEDADNFFETIEGSELTSIRLNPKFDIPWNAEEVPWNNQGRYLEERPGFGKDPLFHAGAYYPMEASSMFLEYALDQIEIEEECAILDLCAAPGGKSLILKDHFPEHLLISNEIDGKRVHVLKENVIKWGTTNHLVVQSEAGKLKKSDLRYGLVVVDAPCSGEGLFRKDKASRSEWTLERASGCAIRQNQILDDAVDLLNSGGIMIYSTCTYNPDENMEQIVRLVQEYGFESIPLGIDDSFGIVPVVFSDCIGYQFWPHRLKGEGFFIAVLRKKGMPENVKGRSSIKVKSVSVESSLNLPEEGFIQDLEGRYYLLSRDEVDAVESLKKVGKIVKKGVFLGEIKGKELIPSYDVSHQKELIENYPKVELKEQDAHKYLQGNALIITAPKGPVVLTYKGFALGMGKSNGDRINNLYPKHLRIT